MDEKVVDGKLLISNTSLRRENKARFVRRGANIKLFLNLFIFFILILLINISFISAQKYTLKVTEEHPFFLDGKWIPAKELKVGDLLITDDGKKAKIISIKDINDDVEVYNLEANPFNDFIIAGNVVVHNSNAENVAYDSCFAKGTKISMADGTKKNIEDVKVGELVVSWDFKNNKKTIGEVIGLWNGYHNDIYLINGKIKVTSEHPFWTKENGWSSLNPHKTFNKHGMQVSKLEVGKHFMDENGNAIVIKSIIATSENISTYNLRIKDFENYFVDGILVHNKPNYYGPWRNRVMNEIAKVFPDLATGPDFDFTVRAIITDLITTLSTIDYINVRVAQVGRGSGKIVDVFIIGNPADPGAARIHIVVEVPRAAFSETLLFFGGEPTGEPAFNFPDSTGTMHLYHGYRIGSQNPIIHIIREGDPWPDSSKISGRVGNIGTLAGSIPRVRTPYFCFEGGLGESEDTLVATEIVAGMRRNQVLSSLRQSTDVATHMAESNLGPKLLVLRNYIRSPGVNPDGTLPKEKLGTFWSECRFNCIMIDAYKSTTRSVATIGYRFDPAKIPDGRYYFVIKPDGSFILSKTHPICLRDVNSVYSAGRLTISNGKIVGIEYPAGLTEIQKQGFGFYLYNTLFSMGFNIMDLAQIFLLP